jgi:hypothetical protein
VKFIDCLRLAHQLSPPEKNLRLEYGIIPALTPNRQRDGVLDLAP